MKKLELTDDQKFQALMAQLSERYSAWHQMRARGMQFTLWILGLVIAASWKFIQEPFGSPSQKTVVSLLVILLAAASINFLINLTRGATKNRNALINTEVALGYHSSDFYLPNDSLLPSEYASSDPKLGSHFGTLFALLGVTFLYLLVVIWMPQAATSPPAASETSFENHSQIKPEVKND